MSVREYNPPAAGGGQAVGSEGELAYRPIDVSKALERSYMNSIVQSAGGDAAHSWTNYRRIGEVRYAINRSAHVAGYGRPVAVEVDPTGRVVRVMDKGVEADIAASITSTYGGVRGLIERYYTLMQVPGQGFLVRLREGMDGKGAEDGYFVLSASEINKEGDVEARAKNGDAITWNMRRRNSTQEFQRHIQPEDFLGRLWMPDHEYVEDSSSPMQAINLICDELNTLTEAIAGRLKSRFALAGILLIPNEINDAAISGDKPSDNKFSTDKVMNYLIHVMTTNVVRHAEGLAAMPILLKGPADVLDKVKHLVMEATVADQDLKQRAELIGRILHSLDQPTGASSDGEDQSHWGMWYAGDDERRVAVTPSLARFGHALTRAVMWPQLQERNRPPGGILKYRIQFELSDGDIRANKEEAIRQVWDRAEGSGAALRRIHGLTDADMPDPNERVRIVGMQMKNPYLALHGLEGVEVDWDEAAKWGGKTGPAADSQGDDGKAGPGSGQPGSPDRSDRDSDNRQGDEPE